MLTVNKLALSFGAQELFSDVNFNINTSERIGLVGRNGSGKTTLFNMLTGEIVAEGGAISIPKNYTIGYVKQHLKFTKPNVIEECCLGLPVGYEDDIWKAEKILTGLGFSYEDMYKDPFLFSGGYQVRLNLAKVLVSEPDLLLLDEPTNYLDIVSIRWMERFLRNWPNELVLITHDRTFMDTVTTHTMIIHRQKVKKIQGNTARMYEQIAIEEETHERTRVKTDKQRKEMEAFITRFRSKARLASMAQSRVKALKRTTAMDKLDEIKTLEFSFKEAPFLAKKVMNAENITFSYPNSEILINNFSINIGKSDRVCIVGKNGKGKTTLMNLLNGELNPVSGEVNRHPKAELGVFGQTNIEHLTPTKTIDEELLSASLESNPKIIRSICGSMMFSGDLAKKKISVLSGGEKSRVLLGKLLLTPSNLLFLDEPTNHLDMDSCDSLIEAINAFSGAVVMVTHNEMFLNNIANRLIVFHSDKVEVFDGTYKEFLEKVGWEGKPVKSKKKGTKPVATAAVAPKVDKNADRKALRAIENHISKLEKQIAILDAEIVENTKSIEQAAASNDGKLIAELSKENHGFQLKVDKKYKELETELAKHDNLS